MSTLQFKVIASVEVFCRQTKKRIHRQTGQKLYVRDLSIQVHRNTHNYSIKFLPDQFAATGQADQGPYSPTILKKILRLFLQDFVNLNVIQLLIC